MKIIKSRIRYYFFLVIGRFANLKRSWWISEHTILGETLRWVIKNPGEHIQRRQVKHGIYELKNLTALRNHVEQADLIVDVGANIGNHAVFFLKFLSPRKMMLFEPYTPARQHLLHNVSINLTDPVDVQYYSCGLSDVSGKAGLEPPGQFNIGLSTLNDTGNDIEVLTGDEVIKDEKVNLIKIDVEGMELNVLRGFEKTLLRCKPHILIEISPQNLDACHVYLTKLNFSSVYRHDYKSGMSDHIYSPS